MFVPFAAALSIILNIINALYTGIYSVVKTFDIFWFIVIFYAIGPGHALRHSQRFRDPVAIISAKLFSKPIRHIGTWTVIAILMIPYLFFVFPETYVGSLFATAGQALYSRLIFLLSLYIGFATGVAFVLGYSAPFHIGEDKKTIDILANVFSVSSIISVFFIAIFFLSQTGSGWANFAPRRFSSEEVALTFRTFTTQLLELAAITLGMAFFATGNILAATAKRQLPLGSLGFAFFALFGSLIGILIGPTLYFGSLEISFIIGSMIGIPILSYLAFRE